MEVSFDAYGLPGASRPEIILTDAAGASAVWSDARYSRSPFPSRTFKIDSPLKQAVGAEVAAVSECGDKRLVQVRYRFLTEITSETLLWGLWHFGVVSDDDLLGGSEWRTDREGVLAGADSLQRRCVQGGRAMLAEEVLGQLTALLGAPLDAGARRRIVMWYDAEGEFSEDFSLLASDALAGRVGVARCGRLR